MRDVLSDSIPPLEPTADELVAVLDALPVPREDLCPGTWCAGERGHTGACVTVPRRDIPPTDFGPRAAISTRRRG